MSLSFLLTWQKNYETGVELIDEQHKELISIINLYYVKCHDVHSIPVTLETLKNLQRTSLIHFPIEESIQIQSKYPLFRAHQANHSDVAFQMRRLIQLLEAGNTSFDMLDECKHFILTWLTEHLENYDLPFFDYYNKLTAKNAEKNNN